MNEATIRQWYDIFKGNKDLVEIRVLDPESKRSYSGYFTDIETLLREIKPYDKCNLYFTLNVINQACYSREQHDRISTKPKSTTSDNDIVARKWCLIDIDCEKPSDTNSTDAEKEAAKVVVNNVYRFLRDQGLESPCVCDSCNGWHLLYRMNMINTPENTDIMKKFLRVLDMYFSTDKVKIDLTTFNPSRVCKLYGTISRKGYNTKDRPQRESKIIKVPQEIKATANEYFAKVASYLPEPEKKDRFNNYGASSNFNLDEFIEKHDIKVRNKIETTEYTKYVLEECCFNSSHRAPDSAIFKLRDGSYGFKCLHNSCSHYTFRDFRLHFDPHAYDHKDFVGSYMPHQHREVIKAKPFTPAVESEDKGKKWKCMSDIKRVNIEDLLAIQTGYTDLDKRIVGLFGGELTVLSGLNASGKTSWLDCVALNAVQRGFKVGIWSGEMQDWRFQNWITQIAAGKAFARKKEGYDNLYYVPNKYADKINAWLNDKLFLYNNNYGSVWQQIFLDVKELVETKGVQLIILDNLAALSIDAYDNNKYTSQTKFVIDLKDYAKQKNIHIILVAHPRKQTDFLRKESISGTADLSNLSDNVLICHRVGKDFETRAGEFFGKDKVKEYMQYSAVIEVSKNRQLGVTDYLVGMYYEYESRRLKNDIAENIIYGWQDELGEISSTNPRISDFQPTVEEQTAKEFEASLSPTGEEAPF